MKILTLLLSLAAFCAAAQISSPEGQIADAVLALAEGDRAGATVLGYDAIGEFITLRKGTNSQVCLADNPNKDGFSVACYHQSLDAFMARGRELRADGKGRGEIEEIRAAEAKSGKLIMPEKASNLAVMSGSSKDDAGIRYVVYIPFATAETTGLPTKPMMAGGPWIMFPGSYRAHIMISPAN